MKGFKGSQEAELGTLRFILKAFVSDFRVAVDGGAHVGGWTDVLAEQFDTVHAFEAAPDTFVTLKENMEGRSNVRLYNMALLDRREFVAITAGYNSPSRQVTPMMGGGILAGALDEIALPSCGFLKLDVEGCEELALRGSEETIKRCRPFVLVEELGLGARFGFDELETPEFMKSLGYRETMRDGVNVGYAPK